MKFIFKILLTAIAVVILAKFLLSRSKNDEAKDILEEIKAESQHMTKPNKRIYRNAIQEVEKLLVDMYSI